MTPANRQVRGGAFGIGLLVIGFEAEYSFTTGRSDRLRAVAEDRDGQRHPADAVAFFGFPAVLHDRRRFYREALGTHRSTGVGLNTGGGVKVNLAGPLRLRVDYRVFKLGSDALNSPAHRIYAGLKMKF